MTNSFLVLLISTFLAISLVAAKPISKTGLIQSTLRGTPISTAPRVLPGDGSGPPPEPRYTHRPGAAGAVIWPDHSHVPVILQTVFACLWILVIGSLPFIIPVSDHRPVTKTQKAIGGAMLAVLFGGLYLFTNIILFESVHFKQTRPLTIVECIYFMSQVITTVGYGDIVPAKVRGQVFVGLYVLGALFIIAMLVSDVTNHVAIAAAKYRENLVGNLAKSVVAQHQQDKKEGKASRSTSVHDLIAPPKPSTQPLMVSLACFAVIDICWIIFFSNYPGEQKTMFQAAYMSVITLSTVGLGAFTPLTEGGMIFGAFFMLFGSAALVSSVSNFCTLVVKMNEYERFSHDSKKQATQNLKEIIGRGGKQVDQMQFFEWSVLSQKLMSQEQMQGVLAAFKNLNPVNGVVDLKKVEASMGVMLSPRSLS